VASLAAKQFELHHVERILDVGSGPGKFCLAAGAVEPSLVLTGIEQRPHLVDAARLAARRLRLENVRFYAGDVTSVDWSEFDGFYLFNPFAENRFAPSRAFDSTVVLSEEKRAADVHLVERALVAARVGTTLITYHGFGGRVPRSFCLARSLQCGTDWLNVWVKDGVQVQRDGFWFEHYDEETGAPLFVEQPPAEAAPVGE
jgi:predicted RNA methylase